MSTAVATNDTRLYAMVQVLLDYNNVNYFLRGPCRDVIRRTVRSTEWSCWLQFPSVQLSEVTRSSWILREFSWKTACEEKTKRLGWNGPHSGPQLVELSSDKSSARRLWQEELTAGRCTFGSVKSVARKRLVHTVIDCVCQWSVVCSYERCTHAADKSNIEFKHRL
jgi:hypothetical protein